MTIEEMWQERTKKLQTPALAFLQNPWFKPGTNPRHIDTYRRHQSFRRLVLAESATGKALKRALGDLYDKVWWDNANPLHASERAGSFPPDAIHMRQVFLQVRPQVVILFGRQAQNGWEKVQQEFHSTFPGTVLVAPHPMARGSVAMQLNNVARELRVLLGK